jgi:hypothetical protein
MKKQKAAWMLVMALSAFVPMVLVRIARNRRSPLGRPTPRRVQLLEMPKHAPTSCAPMSGSRNPRWQARLSSSAPLMQRSSGRYTTSTTHSWTT